jgi:hypothetical protein
MPRLSRVMMLDDKNRVTAWQIRNNNFDVILGSAEQRADNINAVPIIIEIDEIEEE